jgi:aspartyl-tRNA(Asn)/glutamyl-tRNA(Gln) amidotransferase subunit A
VFTARDKAGTRVSSKGGHKVDLREYASMSAVDMAKAVRSHRLSPVELVDAALAAIERTDGRINAWCEVLHDQARAEARRREDEAMRGQFRSALHGVPVGIKDLFLTAGIPTRRGSRLYADAVPGENAPVVDRLQAAGAVMVGKNTTSESGWKASSNSPLYGVTRNPWNPALTVGGSSSGSAAAVAAGTVPISMGSDGGGSLRIPAAFAGIFSLKPTLGRVPTYPLSSSEHLSHAGAMTVDVADTAAVLDIVKGADARDPHSLPDDGVSWLAALQEPTPRCRVALAPSLFGKSVDPDIARCVQDAFDRVSTLPGVEAVEARLDWKDPVPIFDRLWGARGAAALGTDVRQRAQMDAGLARLVERSVHLSLPGHLQALQERAAFCQQVNRSFEHFDLLITPMVPIPAFPAERDGPDDMDEQPPVPWARWTPFSYPFNVTGQPAASVPCGWTPAGMPVAMQVIGPRFADLDVLRLCAAWERAFDWKTRRPPVFASS